MSNQYELSPIDVAALKKADRLLVGLNIAHCNASGPFVECVKDAKKSEHDPFAVDVRHRIPAPVSLQYDYSNPDRSPKCWSHVTLYAGQHCEASSILATLRAGDGIAFVFYPDSHTNGYVAQAGLHADSLILKVYRKGRLHAQFYLDTSIGRDNSARMCQGAPYSESIRRAAEMAC